MPKVTLTAPHTHNGKRFAAGETIEVSDRDAAWLREHELISSPAAQAGQAVKNAKQENDDHGTA
ncbi:DUF7210 family protein [Pectobacterium versatile]|uniref:DUF7210 family protein n=1 Tax=Pectobacterium versatile TaxID=2488639 RepID=UPI000DE6CA84|nr:hypothetical protein [Pectobacterium versatile]PVY74790.1 hypothetical protein C7330_4104 [Pectobacterium versatile]